MGAMRRKPSKALKRRFSSMLNRRLFLGSAALGAFAATFAARLGAGALAAETFEVTHTERMAQVADPRSIRSAAASRHRAPVHQPSA